MAWLCSQRLLKVPQREWPSGTGLALIDPGAPAMPSRLCLCLSLGSWGSTPHRVAEMAQVSPAQHLPWKRDSACAHPWTQKSKHTGRCLGEQ